MHRHHLLNFPASHPCCDGQLFLGLPVLKIHCNVYRRRAPCTSNKKRMVESGELSMGQAASSSRSSSLSSPQGQKRDTETYSKLLTKLAFLLLPFELTPKQQGTSFAMLHIKACRCEAASAIFAVRLAKGPGHLCPRILHAGRALQALQS